MICRLCLSKIEEQHRVPLFDFVEKNAEYNLCNIIAKYIHLKITQDDAVSTAICLKCHTSLKELNAFCIYVEQQQQRLQQFPQNFTHKPGLGTSTEAGEIFLTDSIVDIEIKCEPEDHNDFIATEFRPSQYTDSASELNEVTRLDQHKPSYAPCQTVKFFARHPLVNTLETSNIEKCKANAKTFFFRSQKKSMLMNYSDSEDSIKSATELKSTDIKTFSSEENENYVFSFLQDTAYDDSTHDDNFNANGDKKSTDSCSNETVCAGFKDLKPVPKRIKKKYKKCIGKNKVVQPNPCLDKRCGNNCAKNFTEENRQCIHKSYWSMVNSCDQSDWLLTVCKSKPIIRRRTKSTNNNRRNYSFEYIIPFQGKEIKVCQQFLLKTLNISQMRLRYLLQNPLQHIAIRQ